MKAREAKRRAQLPEWRQRIMECRSNGLSVREWCAGQQISTKTYYRQEREILDLAGKQLVCCEGLLLEPAVPAFAELPVPPQKASGEVIAAICKSLSHVE